jgi:hypothetical protein
LESHLKQNGVQEENPSFKDRSVLENMSEENLREKNIGVIFLYQFLLSLLAPGLHLMKTRVFCSMKIPDPGQG